MGRHIGMLALVGFLLLSTVSVSADPSWNQDDVNRIRDIAPLVGGWNLSITSDRGGVRTKRYILTDIKIHTQISRTTPLFGKDLEDGSYIGLSRLADSGVHNTGYTYMILDHEESLPSGQTCLVFYFNQIDLHLLHGEFYMKRHKEDGNCGADINPVGWPFIGTRLSEAE